MRFSEGTAVDIRPITQLGHPRHRRQRHPRRAHPGSRSGIAGETRVSDLTRSGRQAATRTETAAQRVAEQVDRAAHPLDEPDHRARVRGDRVVAVGRFGDHPAPGRSGAKVRTSSFSRSDRSVQLVLDPASPWIITALSAGPEWRGPVVEPPGHHDRRGRWAGQAQGPKTPVNSGLSRLVLPPFTDNPPHRTP